jgi:REP element-mobilizing transposase RayT
VHFPHVVVDAFVVMPDHVHGIIHIKHQTNIGQSANRFQYVIPRSIPSIVRGYKIGVTKSSRKEGETFAWQRNYYEHVIRDARALDNIRRYIRDNPAAWTKRGRREEGGLPRAENFLPQRYPHSPRYLSTTR